MSVVTATNNWLERLVDLFFSIIIGCLAALFWITILAPGNETTAWFFSLISPLTAIFQSIYNFFGYPIRLLCGWVASLLPPVALAYFPTTTVRTLVTGILDLLGIIPGFTHNPATQAIYNWNFESWFPGTVDWQILFTISFVGFIGDLMASLFSIGNCFSSNQQTTRMVDQNRSNLMDEWSNNQPFTPAQFAPQPTVIQPVPAASHTTTINNYYPPYPTTGGTTVPMAVQPATVPYELPVNNPEIDPQTGLMSRQAFEIQFQAQHQWAQNHGKPIGVIWLELSTLSVTPAQTLLQLGRWLNNISISNAGKKERIMPVRYGAHSIVVALVNQSPAQCQKVAMHLQQRLNEFNFSPLIGLSHSQTLLSNQTPQLLLQNAYQQAIQQPLVPDSLAPSIPF